MRKKNEIQTVSTNINQKYYISTGYRESSAFTECEIWYYETLVWSVNNRQLEKIIYSEDSGSDYKSAKIKHNRLVRIFEYLEQRNLRNTN